MSDKILSIISMSILVISSTVFSARSSESSEPAIKTQIVRATNVLVEPPAVLTPEPTQSPPKASIAPQAVEIPKPPPQAVTEAPVAVQVQSRDWPGEPGVPGWPWGALADCETGGRDPHGPYGLVPGSRNWRSTVGRYDGGLQFLPSTWRSAWRHAGRGGSAGHAYEHPARVQVEVAVAWLEATSWRQWPACSRRLGLR